jgi:hypothetical protein
MVNLFTKYLIEEHGYLFSGMKKRIRISQLTARVKAGGKALEKLPVISPSRVQDLDGPGPDLFFGPKIPWQRPNHNSNGRLVNLCRTRAGRPPGASVMDEQKLLPSSLPEKRYPCSPIRGSVNKPVPGQVQELTICPIKDYALHTYSV